MSAFRRMPSNDTMAHAAVMSLADPDDFKPIMMDYWYPSLEQKVRVCQADGGAKVLAMSANDHTSPIIKGNKIGGDMIIQTENSIYVVDASVYTR